MKGPYEDEPRLLSLSRLPFKTLGDAPLKDPGFFNERVAPCPDVIKRNLLAELLHCAGFGMRAKAKTIFLAHPELLMCRGNLTDITKTHYNDITAFEYAVRVKDAYYVKNVVDFIETTYQGDDKAEIASGLLEQFNRNFSTDRLASVNGFIKSCNTWRDAWPNRSLEEKSRHLVHDVGEAQARFEAHILQEYCHPKRSFFPTPKFDERDLPEYLSFYNCNTDRPDSFLTSSPGLSGNFYLLRWDKMAVGDEVAIVEAGAELLDADCAAIDALDKARTSDLLSLKQRLELMITPTSALQASTSFVHS